MKQRSSLALAVSLACGALSLVVVAGRATGGPDQSSITIWSSMGGEGYGASKVGAVGFVTQTHTVDVPASGEIVVSGVSDSMEPWSLQIRSITDGAGTQILSQRLAERVSVGDTLRGAIGKEIVVTTESGDVSGILRAVDDSTGMLSLEKANQEVVVVRVGGKVSKVTLPKGTASVSPSVIATVKSSKPGRQVMESTYMVNGLRWSPVYTAIAQESGTYDLRLEAVISNDTTTLFPAAKLTLMAGDSSSENPTAYALADAVELGARARVKVNLVPPVQGVRGRQATVFEPISEQLLQSTGTNTECYSFPEGATNTKNVIELPIPGASGLPAGPLQVYRMTANGLVPVSTGTSDASGDVIRVASTSTDSKVTGSREHKECRVDASTRSLREKVVVTLNNPTASSVEVLVREPLGRGPIWEIESEDKKGLRTGPRIQEYRVKVDAKAKQTITYTVVYKW